MKLIQVMVRRLQKTQKEAQWFASLPGSFVIRSWQENKIRRLLFRVSVVHTGATVRSLVLHLDKLS